MPGVVGVPLSRVPGHGEYGIVAGDGGLDGDGPPLCLIGLTAARLPDDGHDESRDGSRHGDLASAEPTCLVTAWSPGAEQIFGHRAAEIVGRPVSAIVPPERRAELQAALETIALGDDVPAYRTVWRRRDGRDVGVRVALNPLVAGTGEATAVAIVTDLGRTARVDERLRQAQRLTVIGAMSAGIAHDFNNLVTVMYGYNELVLAGLLADDPRREYLLEVRGAAERATRLTRGLLAFGRRKAGAGAVDVNALIRESEGIIRLLAGKYVHLTLSLCPDVAAVSAPATQIEQAIVNLCVNARDAMAGGGTLTVETRRVVLDAAAARAPRAQPGPYTLVAVSDTGIGMDASLLSRIWEPFFTTKDVGKGTGLGLSTLLAIVKDAGGFVSVESKPGLGTTFRLYLPAAGSRAEESDCPEFEECAALPVRIVSRPAPSSTADPGPVSRTAGRAR
jgi:two-component system cell cycle sensor histidine kinase/response regulator CckA